MANGSEYKNFEFFQLQKLAKIKKMARYNFRKCIKYTTGKFYHSFQ